MSSSSHLPSSTVKSITNSHDNGNVNEHEDTNKEARYKLRARCLDIWLQVVREQPLATFNLVDGSIVTATLNSTHSQETHYRVSRLNTPIGQYSEALIRQADIQSISLVLSSNNDGL